MGTFGGIIGEVVFYCEFALEEAAFVGRALGSLDFCLNIGDVGFIDDQFDAYLDVSKPTIGRLLLALLHLLRQQHHNLWVHLSVN